MEDFATAQSRLLEKYGSGATSLFLPLRTPALRTHVLKAGAGKPLLLLHGGNSVAACWEPLLSGLARRFSVFAPDRPGCGLSDKLDYRGIDLRAHAVAFIGSVMDGLDLAAVPIVANSMGGYWAMAFALAFPARVTKLVLVGEPAGSAPVPSLMHRLMGHPLVGPLLYATILKPSPRATRESLRRMLVANPGRVPREWIDCAYAAAALPGAMQSWLTMLRTVTRVLGPADLTFALRPELPRLATPTLFLWGDRDALGPPSLGREMAALMPNARAEAVPDAGHLVWLDQPEHCSARIIEYLEAS
jgi:pimeloyl-ACP methyl ester carboxylesterase